MFLVVILTLNVQSSASYAIPLKVPLWWSHVQPREPLVPQLNYVLFFLLFL